MLTDYRSRELGDSVRAALADMSVVVVTGLRQAGKSTTTAIIGLHQALYYSSSLVLLVSPSLRQSRELFGKEQLFMKGLDTQPKLDEDNRLPEISLASEPLPTIRGTEKADE